MGKDVAELLGHVLGRDQVPEIVGHRGAALSAPENTLAGIRRAAELGCRWVEVDVALSAEGVPVLFHDETLERTTNGRGAVRDTSAADLAALDAGGWFSQKFAGEGVPSLESALRLVAGLGLRANLEIKPAPGLERETAEAALVTVRKAQARPPEILWSSFAAESLRTLRRLAPETRLAPIWDALPEDWSDLAEPLQAEAVHLSIGALTMASAATVVSAGYRLGVYTVDDPTVALGLRSLAVGWIFSDAPERLD